MKTFLPNPILAYKIYTIVHNLFVTVKFYEFRCTRTLLGFCFDLEVCQRAYRWLKTLNDGL